MVGKRRCTTNPRCLHSLFIIFLLTLVSSPENGSFNNSSTPPRSRHRTPKSLRILNSNLVFQGCHKGMFFQGDRVELILLPSLLPWFITFKYLDVVCGSSSMFLPSPSQTSQERGRLGKKSAFVDLSCWYLGPVCDHIIT